MRKFWSCVEPTSSASPSTPHASRARATAQPEVNSGLGRSSDSSVAIGAANTRAPALSAVPPVGYGRPEVTRMSFFKGGRDRAGHHHAGRRRGRGAGRRGAGGGGFGAVGG